MLLWWLLLCVAVTRATYCVTQSSGCATGDCRCVPFFAECQSNVCEITAWGAILIAVLCILGLILLIMCCCWLSCCCGCGGRGCCGRGSHEVHHYHPAPQPAQGEPVLYAQHIEF
jgi:hypothetical protein